MPPHPNCRDEQSFETRTARVTVLPAAARAQIAILPRYDLAGQSADGIAVSLAPVQSSTADRPSPGGHQEKQPQGDDRGPGAAGRTEDSAAHRHSIQ